MMMSMLRESARPDNNLTGNACMFAASPFRSAHFEPAAGATPVFGDATLAGVDSRPSDALNLALRFGAPIYVHRQVNRRKCCCLDGQQHWHLQAIVGVVCSAVCLCACKLYPASSNRCLHLPACSL
jgi:Domain of unknown function (DUF151)